MIVGIADDSKQNMHVADLITSLKPLWQLGLNAYVPVLLHTNYFIL